MTQDWLLVQSELSKALSSGLLIDMREELPWNKKAGKWKKRTSPSDILGHCTHHSASENQDPHKTNAYHIGSNHISSKGLPHITYTFGISNDYDGVLYLNDIDDITASQGESDEKGYHGDENRHLVSILVFGDFSSDGHVGKSGAQPKWHQVSLYTRFVKFLDSVFRFGRSGHFGHFDFGKPSCPGNYLRDCIKEWRVGRPRLDTIEQWQTALVVRGYNLGEFGPDRNGVDGDWGARSKEMLVKFQKDKNIRATGERDVFTEMMLLRG